MGLANFSSIGSVVDANRRNYTAYRTALSDIPGLSLLSYDEAEQNNYQYIVMEVGSECAIGRDEIIAGLHAENVLASKYFRSAERREGKEGVSPDRSGWSH